MKLIHGPLGVASLGTLALTLILAGCGGASPGFGGMAAGPNLTPVAPNVVAGGPQDDMRGRSCKLVQVSQDFVNKKILVGRWIWFSSVISARAAYNDEILVRDAKVQFVTGRRTFDIPIPNMRLYIHGYRQPRLHWHGYGNSWVELAPRRHRGEIFATGRPYKTQNFIGTNVKNVTWSARFYALHPTQKFSWQWGAAVYSQLSNNPRALRVKPTRFYNGKADPAGTPLNFMSYLLPGGTGNGGKEYTGGLSKPVEITPCR